eukprot:m.74236 g.74236  ORF g.74236 m.74236 type:complete len:214 (-) comp24639_c0_seq1:86-727(-)
MAALWNTVIRYLDGVVQGQEADLDDLKEKILAAFGEGANKYDTAVDAATVLVKYGWDDIDDEFTTEPDYQSLRDDLLLAIPEKPKFVGIKFCQECNNMLYPSSKDNRLTYMCRNCNYDEVAADPCIYINRMTNDIDTLTLISSDMATDPTLSHTRGNFEPCPQCNEDDAVFFQTLANRDVSGMRLYFVCCNPACKHRWCSQDYGSKKKPEEGQ